MCLNEPKIRPNFWLSEHKTPHLNEKRLLVIKSWWWSNFFREELSNWAWLIRIGQYPLWGDFLRRCRNFLPTCWVSGEHFQKNWGNYLISRKKILPKKPSVFVPILSPLIKARSTKTPPIVYPKICTRDACMIFGCRCMPILWAVPIFWWTAHQSYSQQ